MTKTKSKPAREASAEGSADPAPAKGPSPKALRAEVRRLERRLDEVRALERKRSVQLQKTIARATELEGRLVVLRSALPAEESASS